MSNRDPVGACVSILLPQTEVSDLPEVPAEPDEAQTLPDITGKLVLLVEDDNDVRTVLRRDLVSFGLAVLEAVSADEAKPLLENIEELFLLISDIITPGKLSGTDLAKLAVEQKPTISVLLISGFTEESIADNFDGRVGFLRKPFDKEQLKNSICALVTNNGTARCEDPDHAQ